MSKIVQYEFENSRNFMEEIAGSYEEKVTQVLHFENWKCLSMRAAFENPKKFGVVLYVYGEKIRISPSGQDLLKIIKTNMGRIQEIELNTSPEQQDFEKTKLFKELFIPKKEFTIDKPVMMEGMCFGEKVEYPVWFNTTMKSVNMRPGFAKLDTALPASFELGDNMVNILIGGRTGSGKSALINSLIVTLLLEFPPWELELILADFKIVELSRYANRIPTPHVSIVAATSSTEFALSVFEYIKNEMKARQDVFTATGVQNIKDFRKKFDLVLPRVVLFADEFVQMYTNIKTAMEAGNDKADEQKSQINSNISSNARLGRSMGMHMVLSSQDMDGVLDGQTSGQFSGGITLGSTNSVSNTLIGNSAGTTLEGKGKAYINSNKAGKSVEDNELVWIPFMQDTISEEATSRGELSYLQEQLNLVYQLALQCGWDRKPFFYNETETIPKVFLKEYNQYALDYFNNPREGSEIQNNIYKLETFATIALGREISLTEAPTYLLTFKRRRMANLTIGSTDMLTRIYIMRLVAEGLNNYKAKHIVIAADKSTYLRAEFDTLLENLEVLPQSEIPLRYLNMVTSRVELLNMQAHLLSKGVKGSWNAELVFGKHVEICAGKKTNLIPKIMSVGKALNYDFTVWTDINEALASVDVTLSADELVLFTTVASRTLSMYQTVSKLTSGTFEEITASSFEQIVLWWVGMDEVQGITDYDIKQRLLGYFEVSPTVGIFNIVVAEHWQKVGMYSEKCSMILEHCARDFFMDVNLPRNININTNSFQSHDREFRTRNIIRMFNN